MPADRTCRPPAPCNAPPGGRAGRLFDLVHKLITGGAALAMLVKLLLG